MNSRVNSSSSLASSTVYSSTNFPLSPLIKLERLIQRLNLILSKEKDFEAESDNQLKLLLQVNQDLIMISLITYTYLYVLVLMLMVI